MVVIGTVLAHCTAIRVAVHIYSQNISWEQIIIAFGIIFFSWECSILKNVLKESNRFFTHFYDFDFTRIGKNSEQFFRSFFPFGEDFFRNLIAWNKLKKEKKITHNA